MQKTEWSVTEQHEWYAVENTLFTYSEEEKQENEKNRNNASLINQMDFIPLYTDYMWKWLSIEEKVILSYIHFYTKNWKWIYTSNLDLAKLIEASEKTASRVIQSLENKWYIKVSSKKLKLWTDRKFQVSTPLDKLTSAHWTNWPAIALDKLTSHINITSSKIDNLKIRLGKEWFSDTLIETIIDFDNTKKKWKMSEMKERYIKQWINELKKLWNNKDETMIKIIEQSIMRWWTWIFEIKDTNSIPIWETAPDWHVYTEKDKPGSWYYWDNEFKIYRRWNN